jgi:hypothetical protein
MKLRYRTAIIGFCPDLTNPNAASVPVASLLVGEAERERLGAAVVVLPSDKRLALDELSRMMLGDVPALLRRHLDEVMQALPFDAPLEKILYSLHNGLRNSLQVLEISEETVLEVKEAKFLRGIFEPVLDRGVAVLRKSLEAMGIQLILWPEVEPTARPQRDPATTVRTVPQTSVWPLREAIA